MHTASRTLYIILGDLYDTSPNENRFVRKMEELLESGVKAVCRLAISDQGQLSCNSDLAGRPVRMDMPCLAARPTTCLRCWRQS